LQITPADSFPKLICHHCLSLIILAASVKKKTLESEKAFIEMAEEVEYINSDEEQFDIEDKHKEAVKRKYLIYEDE
jgi:hypothetical protein